MEKYALEKNVETYQRMLGDETDDAKRLVLARLLMTAERELAVLAARRTGLDLPFVEPLTTKRTRDLEIYLQRFRVELVPSQRLLLLVEPGPGLPILEATEAYAAATMVTRADLAGRNLFEVFPDNPADPNADGVANLYASLRTAASTGTAHRMAIQKYDVRDAAGVFQERYWQPVNNPVLDSERHLIALLHEVTDVTDSQR
jgi:hypothetical protein